jgi:hypothetical protein
MSDLTNKTSSEALLLDVAAKVKEDSLGVRAKVVNLIAEKEVEARTAATMSVLDKLAEVNKSLNKVKPDQVFYDVDGKEVQSCFSKEKLEERKKLLEKKEQLDNALKKAFNDNDFSKVKELAK